MRPLSCCSPVCLLVGLSLLAGTANASEATDIPKDLQGSLGLSYRGFAEFGALEEDAVNISQRRVLRNDLDWHIEFAPTEGIALTLGLDQSVGVRYSYPNARPMLFEPVDGGGSYLLSDESQPDVTSGAGLNGVWIGAAFSPYSERYHRGQRSTWRLDVGFRTGSPKKNLFVAKNGHRGSAPGGTALRIAGAASRDMGTGNPWAKIELIKENKFVADLEDEDGQVWGKNVTLQPASQLEFTGGVEVVGFDDHIDTRAAVDFFLGFGYRTWEDVSSGVYLPNVLDGGKEIPMTVGDYTYVIAGLNVDWHINEHVRARTGPDFRFHTPFTPEHAYGVVTKASHIGVGWLFRIEGLAQAKTEKNSAGAVKAVREGIEEIE